MKIIPVLNQVPRHLQCGGTSPCISDFGIIWAEWSDSGSGYFIVGKEFPGDIWIGKLAGHHSRFRRITKVKSLLLLLPVETKFFGSAARSRVTISTELFWIQNYLSSSNELESQ